MKALKINDSDLVEKFILASGKGGQKVNKTACCVYLKHLPTGFEVKCQSSRSQELNRFHARVKLCEKILEKLGDEKSAKQKEIAKIRQQKRRRSRRQRQKILDKKRAQGEKKALRRPPTAFD